MSKAYSEKTRLTLSIPAYFKRGLKRVAARKGIDMNAVIISTLESVYKAEFTQEKQQSVRRVVGP